MENCGVGNVVMVAWAPKVGELKLELEMEKKGNEALSEGTELIPHDDLLCNAPLYKRLGLSDPKYIWYHP